VINTLLECPQKDNTEPVKAKVRPIIESSTRAALEICKEELALVNMLITTSRIEAAKKSRERKAVK